MLLAAVPTLLYLGGIPLHDGAPGTCDAWEGCRASAREQWAWTARPWATLGFAFGAFLTALGPAVAWLRQRPVLTRRVSVGLLVAAGLATAAFTALAVVVWGIDCSEATWICFGGPEAALILGSPGLVSGVVATLLAVGLPRARRDGGRLLAWTTAGVAAAVVAVVVGQAAEGLLARAGAAW